MKSIIASIIIPTYNREKILKATLISLSKQNYPKSKYEIIVVDDGNDETDSMIKKLGIANLIYFKIRNMGYRCISRARNFGIKKANGKIIIFLDSDIVVTPDFVLEHVKSHARNKNLVVIGYVSALETKEKHCKEDIIKLVEENYSKITTIPIIHSYRDLIYEECSNNLNNLEKPWETFLTSNVSVSRQHIIDVGMFDGNFKGWGLEDIELGYRLVKWGLKLKLNRKALGYHIGTDNISSPYLNPSTKKWKEYIKNMKYFLKKHNNIEVKRTLITYDKKIPNKFKLFKREARIEKIIEINNRNLTILYEKQKFILKNYGLLKKWSEIERQKIKINIEMERMKNEFEKKMKRLKIGLLEPKVVEYKKVEAFIQKLKNIEYKKIKSIEPLNVKKIELQNKKFELLKKKKILDQWKTLEKEKKCIQKIFDEKLKNIREPKRIELGEALEKEYLTTKMELNESLQTLRLNIQKIEEELMLMWNKEFESINKEIIRLDGKESLLLKSRGLEIIWKKLNDEENKIKNQLDNFNDKYIEPLEIKINENKIKQISLIKKYKVLKEMDKLEKEMDKLLNSPNEKMDELNLKQKMLLKNGGILRIWNDIEKEKKIIERKNELLKLN